MHENFHENAMAGTMRLMNGNTSYNYPEYSDALPKLSLGYRKLMENQDP